MSLSSHTKFGCVGWRSLCRLAFEFERVALCFFSSDAVWGLIRWSRLYKCVLMIITSTELQYGITTYWKFVVLKIFYCAVLQPCSNIYPGWVYFTEKTSWTKHGGKPGKLWMLQLGAHLNGIHWPDMKTEHENLTNRQGLRSEHGWVQEQGSKAIAKGFVSHTSQLAVLRTSTLLENTELLGSVSQTMFAW